MKLTPTHVSMPLAVSSSSLTPPMPHTLFAGQSTPDDTFRWLAQAAHTMRAHQDRPVHVQTLDALLNGNQQIQIKHNKTQATTLLKNPKSGNYLLVDVRPSTLTPGEVFKSRYVIEGATGNILQAERVEGPLERQNTHCDELIPLPIREILKPIGYSEP
jgi:hypothetical protein